MNNKTTRTTTALEQVVFEYLNELREAGVTNMYGAPSYVQHEFGLSQRLASDLVSLWMSNFNEECDYKIIEE